MKALSATVVRARSAWQDPLLKNSGLILATTLLMAGAGALFWVVAARVRTPEEVGLAGSLATTAEALAVASLMGLNVALVRTMPRSDRNVADVIAASAIVVAVGSAIACVYALVTPAFSPDIATVVRHPLAMVVFALLVAATALNQLTDSMFLGLNRVASKLWINGILMGIVKCGLPLVLVGGGALGLYAAIGGSSLVAATVSVAVVLHLVTGPWSLSPSSELRRARGFAGAGYVTGLLYFVPQVVIPVLLINAQGPADSAVYFVAFQIVTLLNAIVYAICNAMYAEGAREPARVAHVVRKAGMSIALAVGVCIVGLVLLAPAMLAVFGPHYAESGEPVLRVLALTTVAVGLNYWSAVRLRLSHHLPAMIVVQLVSTVSIIVLAYLAAPFGIEAVAWAWGAGQLVGGVLGYVVSRTIAPMRELVS